MNKQLIDIVKRIVLDSDNKFIDKWAIYRELEEYEKTQEALLTMPNFDKAKISRLELELADAEEMNARLRQNIEKLCPDINVGFDFSQHNPGQLDPITVIVDWANPDLTPQEKQEIINFVKGPDKVPFDRQVLRDFLGIKK